MPIHDRPAGSHYFNGSEVITFRFDGIVGTVQDLKLPEPSRQKKKENENGRVEPIQPLLKELLV
jgi:hypothetical protein